MAAAMEEGVVLVHGIWMLGPDLWLLARRLRRHGFKTRIFRYCSVWCRPHQSAERLRQAALDLGTPIVHFVGHSLGGMVIRMAVADEGLPPGRIVTLGTPHRGSFVARRLARHGLGRLLLGRSEELLVPGLGGWSGSRALGVIAGDLPVGIGRLLAPQLPKPHDGTVTVQETEAAGIAAHLTLPVTHTGMLFSLAVAERTAGFLRDGRF